MAVARDGDADRRVLEDGRALEALALLLADVAAVDDEVAAPLHRKHRTRHQQRQDAAVLGDEVAGDLARRAALAHHGDEVLPLHRVVPDAEFERCLANDFVGAVAAEVLEGGVHHGVAAGAEVGQRDDVGAGGDEVREHGLGAPYGVFSAPPLGVVDVDRQRGRAVASVDAHTRVARRDAPAFAVEQPEVHHRQRLARRHRFDLFDAPSGALARVAALMRFEHAAADHGAQIVVAEELQGRRVGIDDDVATVQHQRRGDAREELLVARLGGMQRRLRVHLPGDVARHAPEAAEVPARVEARLAADAEMDLRAAAQLPLHGQVTKGDARFEVSAQTVEHVGVASEARQLPHRAALELRGKQGDPGVARVVDGHQAKLRIELPVGVHGNRQQAREAALALVGVLAMACLDAHESQSAGQAQAEHAQLYQQWPGVDAAVARATEQHAGKADSTWQRAPAQYVLSQQAQRADGADRHARNGAATQAGQGSEEREQAQARRAHRATQGGRGQHQRRAGATEHRACHPSDATGARAQRNGTCSAQHSQHGSDVAAQGAQRRQGHDEQHQRGKPRHGGDDGQSPARHADVGLRQQTPPRSGARRQELDLCGRSRAFDLGVPHTAGRRREEARVGGHLGHSGPARRCGSAPRGSVLLHALHIAAIDAQPGPGRTQQRRNQRLRRHKARGAAN